MNYVKLIAMVCVLHSTQPIIAQVKVVYLANEGVMIQGKNARVLIDPFFKETFGTYQRLPIQSITSFLAQHPELNNADAILISHFHRDHIDAGMVSAYMRENPKTVLVGASQATDSVVHYFGVDASRVINVLPEMNKEIVDVDIKGFGLKTAWLRHGYEKNFGVVNLCFIVDVDGKKIFHLGDTEIRENNFAQVDLVKEKIDLLLTPYWFMSNEMGAGIIKERIKPRHVAGFHVAADYEENLAEIRKHFPHGVVLSRTYQVISAE